MKIILLKEILHRFVLYTTKILRGANERPHCSSHGIKDYGQSIGSAPSNWRLLHGI